MKKTILALCTSLLMGFLGLVLGVLLDESFATPDYFFTACLFLLFPLLTMGAFILHALEKKGEAKRSLKDM